MDLYELELGKACDILIRELFKLKPDETFLITADTESDARVVNASASAAFCVGARPMVVWLPTPVTEGKMADPILPIESLIGAIKGADVWFQVNNKQILDSTPAQIGLKANPQLRYLELTGATADMMIRCVGRVNYPDLKIFLQELAGVTKAARHIRMTTPAGTDVEFNNLPEEDLSVEDGYADTPGLHFMAGQVGWLPDRESIHGTIVFDGSIVPPCDVLEEPVRLTMKSGEIVNIEGGNQAREYEAWLDILDHPQMRKVAHATYGFLPGAKLTGKIAEDERVWGCTVWGFGATSDEDAPSHNDGICLNTSIWLDNQLLFDGNKFLDIKFAKLVEKLLII